MLGVGDRGHIQWRRGLERVDSIRVKSWMAARTMEADQIPVETDSDILDIRLFISFRYEVERIRMKTDSNISNIHLPVFIPCVTPKIKLS